MIKGVHFEGLRKLGDPREFAQRYYREGIDEILYIDSVASLYERNTIVDVVRHTAENVFVPMTVGGGVRSVDDARELLRAGADKVTINTAAIKRPELISELAGAFGSQCVVLSVQAKRQGPSYEAYCEQGRERTGRNAIEWIKQGVELGAGEILLTSVDKEGTRTGYDLEVTKLASEAVPIPVIASGGMGRLDHIPPVINEAKADAVAMAHVLHFEELAIPDIKAHANGAGIPMRPVDK